MSMFLDAFDLADPLDNEINRRRGAGERLEALAESARRCERCPLHEHRTLAVPGEGAVLARIMLIGEAPGKMEDLAGHPFIGKSGELLDQLLGSAGVERRQVFITSVAKCRPVKVEGEKLKNRAPKPLEIKACQPYLVRQVKIIRPRVIVCLGAIAARTVIDKRFDITGERGKWFEGPLGIRMLATFHPAFVLRNGGASAAAAGLRQVVQGDFRMALEAAQQK